MRPGGRGVIGGGGREADTGGKGGSFKFTTGAGGAAAANGSGANIGGVGGDFLFELGSRSVIEHPD